MRTPWSIPRNAAVSPLSFDPPPSPRRSPQSTALPLVTSSAPVTVGAPFGPGPSSSTIAIGPAASGSGGVHRRSLAVRVEWMTTESCARNPADPASKQTQAANFTITHSPSAARDSVTAQSLVTGHGFSHAENDPKMIRSLSPCKSSFTITSAPFPVDARLTLDLHIQEILDHLMPALGQHALRMKLYALDLERPVPQPHSCVVLQVSIGHERGDTMEDSGG